LVSARMNSCSVLGEEGACAITHAFPYVVSADKQVWP
jgi:hypothetical protein